MTPSDDDRATPPLDPKLQAHIGRQLRQLYDEMVSEPVPDRFRALLDQLGAKETEGSSDPAPNPQTTPETGR